MTERPILFSAPMVRAILNGSKTQTRRIVKPQPDENGLSFMRNAPLDWREDVHGEWRPWKGETPNGDTWCGRVQCLPGDRLWVRETCIISTPHFCDRDMDLYNVTDPDGHGRICQYIATSPDTDTPVKDYKLKVTPSIHMPRWASRITLEVVSVRVERLQDISEADAIAEGVWDGNPVWPPNKDLCPVCHGQRVYEVGSMSGAIERDCTFCDTNVKRYKALWQHINGGDSWEANPWVWVVEFRKLDHP